MPEYDFDKPLIMIIAAYNSIFFLKNLAIENSQLSSTYLILFYSLFCLFVIDDINFNEFTNDEAMASDFLNSLIETYNKRIESE